MDNKTQNTETPQKGNILVINTGSTTTKLGYFSDGTRVFDTKLEHTAEDVAKYPSVMDQADMRHQAIKDFMASKNIPLEEKPLTPRFGKCVAYIADPPMADEMLPECRMGGIPEFTRKTLFHALNSRAIVRRYLREHGHKTNDVTVIVAHMGGGATISLHRNGKVIDTNHGLGGDGPITPERAGCCPPFELIDMCFSGKYTKEEIQKKLIGRGGAVAYFGTNSMIEVEKLAKDGNELAQTFLKAYVLNICKYIAAMAATADGKVDAILLTGGIAHSKELMDAITAKVKFIAPVEVFPGEDEINSLAENGYMILSGQTKIHTYDKDRIIED